MMIFFSRPEYLILLLAIPILIFFHIISLKSIRKKAIKFANFEAVSRIKGVEIFSKNLTILYLNIAIIALVVLSVSGFSITKQVNSSEMSFVLAIDASWSMNSPDIEPTRLEAAKQAATDFLKTIPEKTRIGIVSFSGSTLIEQEITDNKDDIKRAIGDITLNPVGGTDIFNAVITSANLLREEESKTIILISDGQANINTLQDIIDYSNENKIMIHSLGIGTQEGSVEETGAVFKLGEDTLKTIASETEGKYYNVQNIEDFYASLNEISGVKKKRAIYDLSLYCMIIALALFVLNFVLVNTRYRILP